MTHRHSFYILLLSLAFAIAATASAQTGNKELDRLIGIATMLRSADAAVFNRAQKMLEDDALWTPMDELGRLQKTECTPAESVTRFKLNRLLSRADGQRKYVTSRGDFLNGEDERYDYSLYERSLHAHQSATYQLKGRIGQQTFVLVPHATSSHGLSLSVSAPGVKTEAVRTLPNGCIVVKTSGKLTKEQRITLSVKNNSSTPQSFILINHNSRK